MMDLPETDPRTFAADVVPVAGGWRSVARHDGNTVVGPVRADRVEAEADLIEGKITLHLIAAITTGRLPPMTKGQINTAAEAAMRSFADGLDQGQPVEELEAMLGDLAEAVARRMSRRLQ